jgi:DNA invertase Pin-like site-specific DNA recombinase
MSKPSARPTTATSTTPLRFACLCRVSTEDQEERGESLRTQHNQLEQAVAAVGGVVAKWYEGQEHGTEGHERRLFDQLLTDAGKRSFDAVMVVDPSRWSRDNVRSETGLEVLRDAAVRFFVLATEYNLYDNHARLFLGISGVINSFYAREQRAKSLLNRIARAKRGVPSAGRLPFGRNYDRDTDKWSVDPGKRAKVEDVATRYLAGERLERLAREHGIAYNFLCRTLRHGCGDKWVIDFEAKDLNISESVTMRVPRLLDDKVIREVCKRLDAKRTFLHGSPLHDYLLSGRVFCGQCGHPLSGHPGAKGKYLYYAHSQRYPGKDCPLTPRPMVSAPKLEGQVVSELFRLFGNPAQIARAVKRAVPDGDKLLKRRKQLEDEVVKVERARERVLALVAKDLVSDEQAERQLLEQKRRGEQLRSELDGVNAQLAELPREEELQYYVERVEDAIFVMGPPQVDPLTGETMDTYAGGNDLGTLLSMGREDKRRLIRAVFDGHTLPDGKPAGVYVMPAGKHAPHRPKEFTFVVRGRLDFEVVLGAAAKAGATNRQPSMCEQSPRGTPRRASTSC